jgi:phosphohistidine phosphatase SixA
MGIIRFVFIRHGTYAKAGVPRRRRKGAPLTEEGRQEVRHTAAFLKRQGIRPDLVFTTMTRRTAESAEIVLEVLGLGHVKPQPKESGFRRSPEASTELDPTLARWVPDPKGELTVMFVGHNNQQSYCNKHLVTPVIMPLDVKGGALVYERDAGGRWVQSAHFPPQDGSTAPRS